MLEVGTAGHFPKRAPRASSQRASTPPEPGFLDDIGADRLPALRRRRSRVRRRTRYAAAAVVLILAGIGGALWASSPGDGDELSAEGPAPLGDRMARALGFGIDEVVLTGHRNTADTEIYDALDLPHTLSLASFDNEAVRGRLERLPWIAAVEMRRVWPGRIEVHVAERRPFAVWQQGEKLALVDGDGRVLSAIHRSTDFPLPRIAGDGAPEEAKALMATLQRFPVIAAEVALAERVGKRRWSLHLAKGGALELPPDGEVAALTMIDGKTELAALVKGGGYVIDARVPGRTAVRKSDPGAGAIRSAGPS